MRTHFTITLLSCTLILISGCCKDMKKSCNAGTFMRTLSNDHLGSSSFQLSGQALNDNAVYYNYDSPGKVKFSIGKAIGNICPYTQVNIVLDAKTSALDQSKMIVINGLANWSGLTASYHHNTLLTSFPILSNHVYEDQFKVDLNEAFGDLVGSMDIFISIEFDKLNSFSEDSTYFVDHVDLLMIEADGDQFH